MLSSAIEWSFKNFDTASIERVITRCFYENRMYLGYVYCNPRSSEQNCRDRRHVYTLSSAVPVFYPSWSATAICRQVSNPILDTRHTTHDTRTLPARDRDSWWPYTEVSLEVSLVVSKIIFWTQDLAYRVSCLPVDWNHNLQATVNMKATAVLLLLLSPVYFAGQLYYPPLYWHKDDCR